MTAAGIGRVAVVGAGFMGSGIAESAARAGSQVLLHEMDEGALERSRKRIETSVARAVDGGKMSREDGDALIGRIEWTRDFHRLSEADLAIEAIVEDETAKASVFERLDGILGEGAIIASNTSSIPIVKLGAVAGRPDRVMGVHFFNPAPVMQLVELIPSLTTSPLTLAAMQSFVAERLGKQPIVATDRAGFVVNSLLVPYLLSAIRMYEAGYASATDIDKGMVLGCAHPMGPLALSDLIGLDTIRAIGISMYDEFKEPLFAPPPLLDRMVDAGLLGKKSGHGFYPY